MDDTEADIKPVLSVEGDIEINKTIDLGSDSMCCRYSSNGKKVAVGLSNGTIKLYKTETMSCIYQLSDEETLSARLPVTSLSFLENTQSSGKGEMLLATYASGMVKFWHISSQKVLHAIHEPRQVLNGSLSNDGSKFVTTGSTGEVMVYDVSSGKETNVCEPSPSSLVMDGHRCRVFAIKHHPSEENYFITGGWDDTIQYWDHRQARSTRYIFGPHICGDGLDIDPKFNHILSASWRKQDSLQVWDFNTGNRIKTIPPDFGNNSLLYCCDWLGKNYIMCGGCDSNMLRILDKTTLATCAQLVGLPGGVYSAAYDCAKKPHHHHEPEITKIVATICKSLYVLRVKM